mmetsp:Transcript_29546/g.62804  ORF Transcript_29546/g.62804 Transcript_29546/m.62804 type:complete len:637 (+) Transcript_29546:2-1912(+)
MVRLFFLIFLVLTISVEPVYTLAARHLAKPSEGVEEAEGEEEEEPQVPTTVLLLVFLYIVLVWCSLNIVYESLLARSLQTDFPNEIVALLVPRCIRERVERWVSSTMGLVHQGQELVTKSKDCSKSAADALDSICSDIESKLRRGDTLTVNDFDDSWIDTKMKEPWAREFVGTCREFQVFRSRSVAVGPALEVDLSASQLNETLDKAEEMIRKPLTEITLTLKAAISRLRPSAPTSTNRSISLTDAAETSTTAQDLTQIVSFDVNEICRSLDTAREAGKWALASLSRAAGEVEQVILVIASQWQEWEMTCFRLMKCTKKLKFLKWGCYRHMHLSYAISSAFLVIYSSVTSAMLLPNWMESPIAWCFMLLSISLAGFSVSHSVFSYFGMNKDAGWQPLADGPETDLTLQQPLVSQVYGSSPEAPPFMRILPQGQAPPSAQLVTPCCSAPSQMQPVQQMQQVQQIISAPGAAAPSIFSGFSSPTPMPNSQQPIAEDWAPPEAYEAVYHEVATEERLVEVIRSIVQPKYCPHCAEQLSSIEFEQFVEEQVNWWETRVPNPESKTFRREMLFLKKMIPMVVERPVAFVGRCPRCAAAIDGRLGLPEGCDTTDRPLPCREPVTVTVVVHGIHKPSHLNDPR